MRIFSSLRDDPTLPAHIILKNFSSQWFLLPQSTGVLSVILHQLSTSYQLLDFLSTISQIFCLYAILQLFLALSLYLLRLILFSTHLLATLTSDPHESSCLAAISTSFTTIIQMMALTLVHSSSHPTWSIAIYTLWWLNAALAIFLSLSLLCTIIRYSPPGLNALAPAASLPLIATLAAAAGGGVICRYGELSNELQIPIIIVSYLMIGMILPLAVGLNALFVARLVNGVPLGGKRVFQTMILCGPWGLASFALQSLGVALMKGPFEGFGSGIFLTKEAAGPVGYASIFAGLVCWGQGTFWWGFACFSILHEAFDERGKWRGWEFGLGAWSVLFPWGGYTNAAIELGVVLNVGVFKIGSTVLAVLLVVIWVVNQVLTVRGVIKGDILGLEHGWREKAYRDEQEKEDYSDGTRSRDEQVWASTGGDSEGYQCRHPYVVSANKISKV